MSNLICCYNLYKKCAFMLEKVYLKCFFFNSKCFCFPFRQDASLYSGNYMTIGSSGKSQRTARYFLLHQSSAPRSQACMHREHVCRGNIQVNWHYNMILKCILSREMLSWCNFYFTTPLSLSLSLWVTLFSRLINKANVASL